MRSINFSNLPDISKQGNIGTVLRDALQTYMQLNEAEQQPKLRAAEIKQAEARANLPFGGMQLPGVAGQVLALDMMRKQFGENSPQYQQAQEAFRLNQQSIGSRIGYQNALTGSMPMRYTTPQGRSFIEQSNVSQGFSPAGTPQGKPVIPGQPAYQAPYESERVAQQYELKRLKENTDPKTRERIQYAENIDKTLDRIDPSALTRYAGAKGSIQGIGERIKAPFGKESREFKEYSKAVQNADALSKQVRQFYGDSIQPIMLEKLEYLINPSSWKNNPELTTELFNELKALLQNETQTYRDSVLTAKAFTGEMKKEPSIREAIKNLPEGKIQNTTTVGNKNYVQVNGEWYEQ